MPAAPVSLVALALLAPLSARAGGQSIDVELLRPGFSPGLAVGVDDPDISEQGTVRFGTVVQYIRDPLVLYEFGDYVGSVVDHRIGAHLGFSWDPRDDLSLRVVLPTAAQWGTEVPDYAAEVVGIGDLSAGVRFSRWTWNSVEVGLRGDLSLPIGSQEAYMGERYPRLHLGVLGALDFDFVRFVGDAGLTFRAPVDTEEDLYLGQELVVGGGASAPLVEDRLAVSASVLSRLGLTPTWHGSAELPVEAVAAAHVWPVRDVRLDVGVGKGVGFGYGTSNFRVLAGVTVTRAPQEPEVIIEVFDEPEVIPEDLPEAIIEDEPDIKVWREGERARLEEDRIELRDPIRFELGTARILEESLPILHAVADILDERWNIGELLIEGHASEEGSYTYNHDLSILRAASIYKELMLAGVHPERMSYRGMGEVQPAEGNLAASRRVEFQVLRWAEPGEETPPVVSQVPKPWDGELTVVHWPRPPAAPARPERDDDEVAMLPWESLGASMEIACDAEVGEQVVAAEARLQADAEGFVDVDGAATALARAEAAMSCGPVVGARMLGRFWLAAGATAVATSDIDTAMAALAAAHRVAPAVEPEAYDPWTRKVYSDARKEKTVYGWLTVSAPPGWWTAVDGAEVLETHAVPAGLHVVQTGMSDRAGFARVISVQPARETVVTVVQEPSTAGVHLGSTVHDPWAPVVATAAPIPKGAIQDSVRWPDPVSDEPPKLAFFRRDEQPTPWAPPGLADPSVVFTRPRGLDAWYERLDSWDLSLGSATFAAGALGCALVSSIAQYRFSRAEDWGAARTWSGINHAAIIGGSALGLASAGLLTWAVVEGEW